ncbi:MAG TPA: peroxiredoxin [Burkholderiaceae bacterium]|nr:peroxiredoxin [Burkholderiaceae bacterium]
MSREKTVAPGKKVPDFSGASTAGQFRLSSCRGKILVLYFYPKDNTPGCTSESRDFAAANAQFAAAGARVVGVSRDSLASHERFRSKYELPFELISDADETLCSLFAVIKQKMMYGKSVRGIERSTFLIDGEGVLRHEWRGLKVAGHVAEVLQAVHAID